MESFDEFVARTGGNQTGVIASPSFDEFVANQNNKELKVEPREFVEGPQPAPRAPVEVAPPEPVDPDSASSIIGRSVDQMQGSLGSALEVAGQLTGSQFLEDAGKDYYKEQQEEAAQYGTPSISSYKQVEWDNPDQIGAYLKQMGLSTVPSLATGISAGVAGAKVGSKVGGTRGAIGGGILGTLMSAFPMNIGEVQNSIREIDPEGKSPWAAVLGGTAMSALDTVGLTSIVKPLVKTFGKDIAYQALKEQGVAKELAMGAVKNALVEAPTEAAQTGIQALAAAKGTDTTVNTEKMIEDMINSAVAGGIGGGVAGGGVGAVGAVSNNNITAGQSTPSSTFSEGRTKPLSAIQRGWDALGSSSAALLEPLARVSPGMEEIIRTYRPDMTGEKATKTTIFEDGELMVGDWTSRLQEGMRTKDADAVVQAYIEDPKSPEAKPLRDIMDDVHQAATDAGLETGYIEGMLPTSISEDLILQDRPAFEAMVSKYYDNPTEMVDNYLEQLRNKPDVNTAPKMEKLFSQDPTTGQWEADPRYRKNKDPLSFKYKVGQGSVPPKFGHLEKSRAFGKIPQKELQAFTKEQSSPEVLTALRDYFEGAAHRIAAAKAFGPSGEKLNYLVGKSLQEARAAGYTPTSQEIDRVYNMADAYNGMYNNLKTEAAKSAVSALSTVATMKALPLTVLSSLVETVTPAIRGDLKSAILEIAPTIFQITRDSLRKLTRGAVPRNEFSTFAAESNLTLGSSLNVASSRLGTNVFGRTSTKVLRAYFLVNGLTLWTHMLSTYSARVGDRVYRDNLRLLSSGLPVTSPKGAQAANQLRSLGAPVYTNDDARVLFQPKTEAQRKTSDQFRKLAIRRFKDQTVLEPNLADTPMWMSNGHLQMFALLNRYPAAFGNIILPQIMRRMRPSWAGSRSLATQGMIGSMFIIGMMLTIGFAQDWLKMVAKTGEVDFEDDRTEAQIFLDVFNTTLASAQVSRILDFAAAPRYGRSGADTLAGPIIGMGTDAVQTISNFAENNNEGEIWKYLYKQTPAQFFRPAREAAGEFELFD